MIYTNSNLHKVVKVIENVKVLKSTAKEMLEKLKSEKIFYIDTETYAPDFNDELEKLNYLEIKKTTKGKITQTDMKSADKHVEEMRGNIALDERNNAIRLLQISTSKHIFILDKFEDEKGFDLVVKFLSKKTLAGHNLKFDLKTIIDKYPDFVMGELFDTMIAYKLIRTAETTVFFHSRLSDVVKRYAGIELKKDQGAEDWSKPLTQEMFIYAVLDVFYLPLIVQKQIEEINKYILVDADPYFNKQLKNAIAVIEMKFISQLVYTELKGVPINVDFLVKHVEELRAELSVIAKEFVDKGINTQSPKQLLDYLETIGVDDTVSTSQKELIKYASNPKVANLIKLKKLQKELQMVNDYVEVYMDKKTKRLFPSFNQIRAVTGRMSCYDPNTQQFHRNIKSVVYKAPKGYGISKADYPSIEARLMGAISKDKMIIKIFKEKRDMHIVSAAAFKHKKEEDVTKEERFYAKAPNFGFMFGMGALTFIRYAFENFGIVVANDESFQLRKQYLETYSGVKRFHDTNSKLLSENREIIMNTILGRRMRIDNFTNANNAPIQGSAADMVKLASIIFYKRVREEKVNAEIINIVHDEIVIEYDMKQKNKAEKILKESMEQSCNYIIDDFHTEVEVETIKT